MNHRNDVQEVIENMNNQKERDRDRERINPREYTRN